MKIGSESSQLSEEIIIKPGKDLNQNAGEELFREIRENTRKKKKPVILDLQEVENIDSFGIAWLLRYKKYAKKKGFEFRYENESGHVAEYLELVRPAFEHIDMKPPRPAGFFEGLGEGCFRAKKEAADAWELIIDVIYWTFIAPFRGGGYRWSLLWDELHEIGVRAVWIVFLINYLLGFIVAMLAAAQVRKFGAGIYVADLVSIGFAR